MSACALSRPSVKVLPDVGNLSCEMNTTRSHQLVDFGKPCAKLCQQRRLVRGTQLAVQRSNRGAGHIHARRARHVRDWLHREVCRGMKICVQ